MTLSQLTARLGEPRAGKYRCPAHEDSTASLRVTAKDDKLLVHCFAGCDPKSICNALGITLADLMPERDPRRAYTLAELATAKRLPVAFLLSIGLADSPRGVEIPYRNADGTVAAVKLRTAESAKTGSRWPAGKPLLPYGRDRKRSTTLTLVEGESDCWTLWHHNIPALGIPGASATRCLAAEDVAGVSSIQIIQEPDAGGASFVKGLRHQLHSVGYRGAVRVVSMPDGLKDPNALHCRDPQAFAATFAATCETPAAPAPVADITQLRRPNRSRSYLTAVQIISSNGRNVLGNRKLRLNEMTGETTFGGRGLRDVDIYQVRAEIERVHHGGVDKNGNEIGLQLSVSDVQHAMEQAAAEASFHPVREYLESLRWDGHPRICELPRWLGADRSPVTALMLRRWMISAVARAFKPGCKVDTMLVLVGEQSARKSTFFAKLAANQEWFCDSAIDIRSKDALLTLRGAWIFEWAELEPMNRARDAEMVKSFLTNSVDKYRAPYGRYIITVPRSGVIVGTTNRQEFLADDTGSRRFWPIAVGCRIDYEAVVECRDQLWAEAVAALRAGEQWWLDGEEEAALKAVHRTHEIRDEWDVVILPWAKDRVRFGVSDVLRDALNLPAAQWGRAEQMRVARILRRAGYLPTKSRGVSRWSIPDQAGIPDVSPGETSGDTKSSSLGDTRDTLFPGDR